MCSPAKSRTSNTASTQNRANIEHCSFQHYFYSHEVCWEIVHPQLYTLLSKPSISFYNHIKTVKICIQILSNFLLCIWHHFCKKSLYVYLRFRKILLLHMYIARASHFLSFLEIFSSKGLKTCSHV